MYPTMTSTAELERELGAGERLLWSGRPKQGLRLRPSDVFLIPFSFLWAGFAVFWEGGVLRDGAPAFFILWGIPFLCVGAYVTVGRFFVDSATRARTWYGVTSERVMIVSGLLGRSVKSLPLRSLPGVTLDQRADGSGTIVFGQDAPFASWYRGMAWPGMGRSLAPAFDLLPQAREAYEVILQAQRAA